MEFDKDLAARQEARMLCRQAQKAQSALEKMSQQQLDAIVETIAKAFSREAAMLADMAVRETGFGNPEDKVIKNHYAAEYIYNAYRNTKTCGVIEEDKNFGIKKIIA